MFHIASWGRAWLGSIIYIMRIGCEVARLFRIWPSNRTDWSSQDAEQLICFLAHGNFGILIIDHRRGFGLAPWRCWPFALRAALIARRSGAWTVSRLAE